MKMGSDWPLMAKMHSPRSANFRWVREPGARGHLGGPRQCLRVDILPDVLQFAISNGNGEDPIVLECPIRGFDSPPSEADDQNPVSLPYELGGLWERSFHRFVSLLKKILQSRVPTVRAGQGPVL